MNTIRNSLLLMMLTLALAALTGCGDDDPTGPGDPSGPKVLVLTDGGTEGHVISTLKNAGMSVRNGGLFHEFTGDGLAGIDAVVLLAGKDYNHDVKESGQAALVAFVGAGGGLLHTEWLHYSIARSNFHQRLKNILPATYGGSYGNGQETYTVQTDHPVTKNLPASFRTGNTNHYSILAPRSGAKQLVRGNRSGAALVSWTRGGRVISWNMTGTYGGDEVWNTDLDRLLVNATTYVAGWSEEPVERAEFELSTGFFNVTYDGDGSAGQSSEGDFYITMEIMDRGDGQDQTMVAQDKTLVQVPDGRVMSPGPSLTGEVPKVDGRQVSAFISIYENDTDGPQDYHGTVAEYRYDAGQDCWIPLTGTACNQVKTGVLSLRGEPGEDPLIADLNWELKIN
jgi:hypothetical protein